MAEKQHTRHIKLDEELETARTNLAEAQRELLLLLGWSHGIVKGWVDPGFEAFVEPQLAIASALHAIKQTLDNIEQHGKGCQS